MPGELDKDLLFDDLFSDAAPGAVPNGLDPQDPDPIPNDPNDPVDPPVNPLVDEDGDPIAPVDPVDPTDPVDPADPTDPTDPVDPKDPADPIDPKDPKDPTGTENLSGIEQYLSGFDIEGGMITFEDGTSEHFNDLEADKQAEILSQLHSQQSSAVEEKYGLDEDEIGLVNYLRDQKMTVDEMVEVLAQDRVNTILATQQVGNTDYETMEEDAVYLNFLKRSNPEATTEQLEEDLEKAKQQSTYTNVVESVRKQFKGEQQATITASQQKDIEDAQQNIETQRQQVVDAAININEIDGIQLNDGVKNGILDQVLEVNDHGDSLFMEEVFGSPPNLIKAAFWYKNGPDLMKQNNEYWKKEKSAAYKRGRESALGTPDSKISFTKPIVKEGDKPVTPSQSDNNYTDLDELHFGN